MRGSLQQIALKIIFVVHNMDALFLQETMCLRVKVIDLFNSLLIKWKFNIVYDYIFSRGLLFCWSPRVRDFKSSICASWILMDGIIPSIRVSLTILNSYGPYENRETLLLEILNNGFILRDNPIITWYLNLTFFWREMWGQCSRGDRLDCLFPHWLESTSMVYIEPLKLSLTWSNNIRGESEIGNIMDRFLFEVCLLPKCALIHFLISN